MKRLASHLLSPSCFLKDLGRKHIRYFSYNELAYLHKNYVTPDPQICDLMGVRTDERYVIMRFVGRTAVHDIGQKGLSPEMKIFVESENENHNVGTF